MKILAPILLVTVAAGAGVVLHRAAHSEHVGPQRDGTTVVATGQVLHPVGDLTVFNSRPVDLVVSPDGRFAYLKDNQGLTVVDASTQKLVSQTKIAGGDSFYGMVLSEDGRTLATTTATNALVLFAVDGGTVTLKKRINLPSARVGGSPNPCGVVFQDADHAFVCLNRDNSVARVDLNTDAVEKWDTDVAPFSVAVDARTQRLYVSCWSRAATKGEPQALSSGTNVPVDDRGVGLGGRLTVISLRSGQQVDSIPIGHHSAEVDIEGQSMFIPCSGSDTLEQFTLPEGSRQTLRLFPTEPVGSAPASMALSNDGTTAYIACSGRNSVLVYDLAHKRPVGEYPTAWYPTTVRLSHGKLFVACTKGLGERAPEKNPISHNSWDLTGALSVIPVSTKPEPIRPWSSLMARKGAPARPIPERLGEPSLFKHVVYVIRENRTYDQVFGDMKEGDGDPSLCNFGEEVTPNAHAIARQYALLDNYYCNGICSADGHSWATEGNTTANLERSVSGWPRSYPFGDDALNTSSTGFLWDEVLAAGKSFINFGEFDYASTANKETYFDCLKQHEAGATGIKFKQNIGVARMRQYAYPGFPGWDLSIPDVCRADVFVKAMKKMEAEGSMPSLTILYLCCDHTGGPVTGRAQVADNDLATGMCVEAITKSKFWKDTCIFVEEDDPQAGWDHVDGHRSPCLVVSPYTRGLGRVSAFYNQTSVTRTIEQIFGIPSKSRFSAISPLMSECFTAKFDTTPYTAVKNKIPLNETSKRNYGARFNLTKPDLVDDREFNRAIWEETMPGKPYPAAYEGAHGKGLASRGLTKVSMKADNDD